MNTFLKFFKKGFLSLKFFKTLTTILSLSPPKVDAIDDLIK